MIVVIMIVIVVIESLVIPSTLTLCPSLTSLNVVVYSYIGHYHYGPSMVSAQGTDREHILKHVIPVLL